MNLNTDNVITIDDIKLVPEDVLGNGRIAYKIKGGYKIRNEITNTFSKSNKESRLSKYGVHLIDEAKNYSNYDEYYYDCQDWLFDKIGMPNYTCREGGDAINRLLYVDVSNLNWSAIPENKCISTYFSADEEGIVVNHWALVTNTDEMFAESKWGPGDAYKHKIPYVPKNFNDYIMFFKIKK